MKKKNLEMMKVTSEADSRFKGGFCSPKPSNDVVPRNERKNTNVALTLGLKYGPSVYKNDAPPLSYKGNFARLLVLSIKTLKL